MNERRWATSRAARVQALRLAAFFVVLAPFVVVWDDCGLWTAVGRGVRTVVTDITVAVSLVLTGLAATWLITWPFARLWWYSFPAAVLEAAIPWAALTTSAAYKCMLAVVGALLAAALILWYRDASARLWPQAGADEAMGP